MDAKRENKKIPNEEDYKINFVFKEDSSVDINEVIKGCFLKTINSTKL